MRSRLLSRNTKTQACARLICSIFPILLCAGTLSIPGENLRAAPDDPAQQALLLAARKHGLPEVRAALDAGAPIDARDADGRTAAMFAAYRNQARTLDFLIARGAKLDLQGPRGFTALMYAAFQGNAGVVARLLTAGADYRLENDRGRTAVQIAHERNHTRVRRAINTDFLGGRLYAAMLKKDYEAMRAAVRDGADVNVNIAGVPAVHAAVQNGDAQALRILRIARANMRVRDARGRDLLTAAIDSDREAGASGRTGQSPDASDASDANSGEDSFHYPLARELVRAGYSTSRFKTGDRDSIAVILEGPETDETVDMLQLLLNAGLRVNAGGSTESPLLQAAQNRKYRFVALLLENQEVARTHRRKDPGLLELGLKRSDARLVRVTLNAFYLSGGQRSALVWKPTGRSGYGFDSWKPLRENFINERSTKINAATPLIKAVQLERDDVLDLLLKQPPKFANAKHDRLNYFAARDASGQTAVHIAWFRGRLDILRKLVAAGADVNLRNRYGTSVLLYAVHSGTEKQRKEIPQLLALGARADLRGMHGRTALWWAARLGQTELVELFIRRGATANPVDDYGASALQEARKAGHDQTAQLILIHTDQKLKFARSEL
ncbi:MAG: ankyrin repeat domain-containing protein [bacterium]|nr:ankyrin repeat domain-containing protein [bacterium]